MNFLEQHGYELKNPRALVRSPILTISSVAYSILHTFSVAYILICAHLYLLASSTSHVPPWQVPILQTK